MEFCFITAEKWRSGGTRCWRRPLGLPRYPYYYNLQLSATVANDPPTLLIAAVLGEWPASQSSC